MNFFDFSNYLLTKPIKNKNMKKNKKMGNKVKLRFFQVPKRTANYYEQNLTDYLKSELNHYLYKILEYKINNWDFDKEYDIYQASAAECYSQLDDISIETATQRINEFTSDWYKEHKYEYTKRSR